MPSTGVLLHRNAIVASRGLARDSVLLERLVCLNVFCTPPTPTGQNFFEIEHISKLCPETSLSLQMCSEIVQKNDPTRVSQKLVMDCSRPSAFSLYRSLTRDPTVLAARKNRNMI